MCRGAWQATVHGVARIGHDLTTEPPPLPIQIKKKKTNKQTVNIINGNEEIIRDTTAIKRIMRDFCGQFNKKDQKLSEKQAKHLNRYFIKKDLQRATKHTKKYSTSFVISQM